MTDSTTIENLDIDGTTYVVAEQSEDIQAAVRKYEEWRDRFVVAQDEAALVNSALRDLGAQIVAAIKNNEAQEAVDPADTVNVEDPQVPEVTDTLVVDDA